jgi:hypothetical protein
MSQNPYLPEPRIISEKEIEENLISFNKQPVKIIQYYLRYFGGNGKLLGVVPRHVLEALERPLREFYSGHQLHSLDKAFGGQTAKQRNDILTEETDEEVMFEYFLNLKTVKKMDRSQLDDTRFTSACMITADSMGMKVDNVKRILKKYGKRARQGSQFSS